MRFKDSAPWVTYIDEAAFQGERTIGIIIKVIGSDQNNCLCQMQ